jgi:MFS superfamily sulfate permease-like transporter
VASKSKLGVEMCAALILVCIALPLNVGVALASGVPAELGIVSGVVASLVTGFITSSQTLISGPDAGIGVLIIEMVQRHGLKNLGIIVFLAGVIQILTGLFGASKWFRAVSPAVVNGMLGGMGLIIIFTQFHIMLDDAPKDSGLMNLVLIPETIMKGLFPFDGSSHHMAALLGISTILIACTWLKFAPSKLKMIPNALIGIVGASAIAGCLGLKVNFLTLPQSLTQNISILSVPNLFASFQNPELLGAAAMLAFVGSTQSLITLTAVDNTVSRSKTAYDRELLAQGIGNTICGILGALPIVGVLLRSIANVQNGATTRLPNVMHGLMMVAVILLFPSLLKTIPTCVLAATLVLIGYRMVSNILISVKKYERGELLIFCITVCSIVATNLFTGVVIGFIAAAIKQLHTLSDMSVHIDDHSDKGVVIMHLAGAVTFLRLPKLTEALEQISDDVVVHLRLDDVRYMDHACLQMLTQWERSHHGRLVIDWDNHSVDMPGAQSMETNRVERSPQGRVHHGTRIVMLDN